MTLQQSDIQAIERLVSRNADDIAVTIARSFERLEERMDSAESRIYNHIVEVEDKIDALRSDAKLEAF